MRDYCWHSRACLAAVVRLRQIGHCDPVYPSSRQHGFADANSVSACIAKPEYRDMLKSCGQFPCRQIAFRERGSSKRWSVRYGGWWRM
jgi:hypothetical protein